MEQQRPQPYYTAPWALPPEQNPYYKKDQRKILSRIGFAFAAYLVFTVLVTSAIYTGLYFFFPSFVTNHGEAVNMILMIIPSYLLGVPLVAGLMIGLPKKRPEKKKLRFEGWITFLAIAFFLMLAGSYIATFLMNLIESVRGAEITNAIDQQITESSPLSNLILVVIIAPIAEEIMCRKLVIDRLLPYSEVLAVVTSGVMFGLLHGNFYQFFYAAFLGILFGAVYVKTGNILHTIIMHMIINFTGSIIADFIGKMSSDLASAPTSINPWDIVGSIYSLAMMLLALCGAILFIRGIRRHKLKKTGDRYLTLSTQFKLGWVNAGMITYGVLCMLTFINSLFI